MLPSSVFNTDTSSVHFLWLLLLVDQTDGDVLCGTVLRKVICTLIMHKAFGPSASDPMSPRRISPLVNWGTLECIYPKYPDVDQLKVSDTDR